MSIESPEIQAFFFCKMSFYSRSSTNPSPLKWFNYESPEKPEEVNYPDLFRTRRLSGEDKRGSSSKSSGNLKAKESQITPMPSMKRLRDNSPKSCCRELFPKEKSELSSTPSKRMKLPNSRPKSYQGYTSVYSRPLSELVPNLYAEYMEKAGLE